LKDASQPPGAAGDPIDQWLFKLAGGLELCVELLGETAEECGVLTREQRSFGEQAVLQRVVANGPLPILGLRAS
jgi:hypothetical protein